MTREIDTCVLATFLDATWTKPEEQATAVLGCALRTSRRLQQGLLRLLETETNGEVDVKTEVQTGRGRDRIDLQLEAFNVRGGPEVRVWIEVKVTALLMAGEAGEGEEENSREPQLKRYRLALDERDAVRPHLKRSMLVLLVPTPDDEDRRQAAETASKILLWQEVGDLAAECARLEGGPDWRTAARQATATLELANLETLVWFLEEATRPSARKRREEFVGIRSASEPLTPDVADHFGHTHRSLMTVYGLIMRASEMLDDEGWKLPSDEEDGDEEVAESEDDSTSTLSDDEKDVFEDLTVPQDLALPSGDEWWKAPGNSAWFQAAPFDDTLRPRSTQAVMQVGVSFGGAGGTYATPAWLEQLDKLEFRTVEHPGTEALAGIWRTKPLDWFIEPASAPEQARRVAQWVEESLTVLAGLPPHGSSSQAAASGS